MGDAVVICQTPNCGKPASLQCPKCIQLKLEPSKFCTQECFKGFWNIHKLCHDAPQGDGLPPAYKGFKFTGPLRPARLSPWRTVPAHIAKPDYAETGIPESEIKEKRSHTIIINSPAEIEGIRAACKIGREVLDIAGAAVKAGMTTDELDSIVHEATIARDAYPSPLNYNGFKKSCCTSVNEIVCHGIPDSRPLQNGDIVNVDISVYYKGFHGDLNETFLIGEVDETAKRLVQTTYESLNKAIEIVKPGTLYRDVGEVISRHVHKQGFSVIRTYVGHGVGKLFHCAPNVPHYAKNKAVGSMKPGHVFTIEPMINEGTYHSLLWPDNWTCSTEDGKRSAQFEHTLLVTETGCEVLTQRTKGSYIDRFI